MIENKIPKLMKIVIGTIIIFIISMFFISPFIALVYEATSISKWKEIIEDSSIYLAVYSTTKIAFLTLGLNFIIGIPAASVLYKDEVRIHRYINGLLYLPLIVPGLVITLGIHFSFIKLGLIETTFGVVLIHTVITLPYFIKALVAGYKTIDRNYYSLGKIVGASKINMYTHITLPRLFPSIIAGSSLVIIVSFAQYVTTLIIGGGKIITLPILIYPYISNGNFKVSSIFGLVFILVNIVLLFSFEKFMKKLYSMKED